MEPEAMRPFADRLRQEPSSATVPGSLPVLFFGDLPNASTATIGLNPSRQEFNSPSGVELNGIHRRFETLSSLGVPDRTSLSPSHVDRAVRTMTAYFEPSKPVYKWFRPLARLMDGFGSPYASGHTAHLDLVQEATDPLWSALRSSDRVSAAALLGRDLEFLRWEIETFPLATLVCTSATVRRYVLPMLNARVLNEGTMARLKWFVAVGSVSNREVGVVGWNIPLMRPAGLDNDGQRALGALLRSKLNSALSARAGLKTC
jgi:hypothetical protein